MVSIEQAFNAVIEHTAKISSQLVLPVESAVGYYLFDDIFSKVDLPPFRQSAMDGYAICTHSDLTYVIKGEVKAGDGINPELAPGEAVRIFTGAAVPDAADVVIKQESVTFDGKIIRCSNHPEKQANIRPVGEQVRKGDLALKRGTRLTPAAIGFLCSMGLKEVAVYKNPSIGLINTGDELAPPGTALTYGEIYESNSLMLKSAVMDLGFNLSAIRKVKDSFEDTRNAISEMLVHHDLVIITGGISVGDYDLVGKALASLDVKEIFYKITQKPGKPVFFGKKEDTVVFALPGNPAAALIGFYLYVYPALQKMTGSNYKWNKIKARSNTRYKRKKGKPQFLKAIYEKGAVSILEGQSSAMLQTFALANALVYVPYDLEIIELNDTVEVVLLPVKT